jgi:AAA domain
MRGDKIADKEPFRGMIIGFPGMAKTGLISDIANLGYKIRMIDYDGNYRSLLQYTEPKFLPNIDIVHIEDKLRNGERFIEPLGVPTAFKAGLDLMDRWKYTEDDGTVVDLGKPSDWGCDTVVVLDSGTRMGDASMRRQMALTNKTPSNMTDATWGTAMGQQDAFIEKLTSHNNKFHVIVIFHKKIVKPDAPRKGEDDTANEIKIELAELIKPRYYPSALGKQLAMNIASRFPIVIEADTKEIAGKIERVINVLPRPELDLKLPSLNVAKFNGLKVTDRPLGKIFADMVPPLASCVAKDDGVTSAPNTKE